MIKGIDSSTPLTAQKAEWMAAQGYRFAVRYLVPRSYAWKRLSRSEAEAITAAGMHIVSVSQTTAQRASGGALAGHVDGETAKREADLLHQPAGSAIYFAVDYDAQLSEWDAIEAYLKAAAAVLPGFQTGVYGSYTVIEEMAKRNACGHFWQTYAWSQGMKSHYANLFQFQNHISVAGLSVNLNESYGNEGWWNTSEKPNPSLTTVDADPVIRILQETWNTVHTEEDRNEIHRLANVLRRASGQPEQ
jgi:hypothetical protein